MFASCSHHVLDVLERHGFSGVPRFSDAHIIRRESLLQQVAKQLHPDKNLLLRIEAPSGYGKTVFAGQLVALLGQRCLWRQTDPIDKDVSLLLASFINGFRVLTSGNADRRIVWERPPAASFSRSRIASAAALLHQLLDPPEQIERWTLVLDDLQLLDNAAASQLLVEQVVERLPRGVDVILISQSPLSMNVTPKQERTQLHIGPAELMLSEHECTLLDYRPHELQDGSCGRRPIEASLLPQIAGQTREIPTAGQSDGDTVQEKLYEAFINTALPPPLRGAMFRIAGLHLLSEDTLGIVYGRQAGPALLRDLVARLPFCYRLGDSRAYRFTASFHRFLINHETHLLDLERSPLLYRLALSCAAAGSYRAALRYAARCCHYGLINDILAICGPAFCASPDERFLIPLLDQIPPSVIRSSPWLALMQAVTTPAGHDELLASAYRSFCDANHDLGVLLTLSLLTERQLLSGESSEPAARRIRQLDRLFVHLHDQLPRPLMVRIAQLLAAGNCLIFGRTEKAQTYLNIAAAALHDDPDNTRQATQLIVTALCSSLNGNQATMADSIDRADALLADESTAPRFCLLLRYLKLKLLVMRGDFLNFRQLHKQQHSGGLPGGDAGRSVQPYLTMLAGCVELAEGRHQEALQLLETGLQRLDQDRQAPLFGLLLQFKALALALLGRAAAARAALLTAEKLQVGATGHPYTLLRHQVAAVVSYLLGKRDDGDRHGRRAEQIKNLIDVPIDWLDLPLHRTACLLQTGEKNQALAQLDTVLHRLRSVSTHPLLNWIPQAAVPVLQAAVRYDKQRHPARTLLARRFHLIGDDRGTLLPMLQIAMLRKQAIVAGERRLCFHELTVLERRLLFELVQSAGNTLAQISTAELLWPEKDPDRQRSSLDNLVSRLRGKLKELVPEATNKVYLSTDHGYVSLSGCRIDALEFLAHVKDAIGLAGAGRNWQADTFFSRAFALLDEQLIHPPDFEHLETIQERFEHALTEAVTTLADRARHHAHRGEVRRRAVIAFRYCPWNPRLANSCCELYRLENDQIGMRTIISQYRQAQKRTGIDPDESAELMAMVTAGTAA